MPTIRYKSCSIEGTRASAVLSFRESIAEAVGAVQVELAKLNDLTTETLDESVVLTGTAPSTLFRAPLTINQPATDTFGNPQPTTTTSLSVYPNPGRNGATVGDRNIIRYRTGPVFDARGGLVGATEYATGHWGFEEAGASDRLTDSTFLQKHAALVAGSAPSIDDGGPLGLSRTFDDVPYFQIATGRAPLGLGESMLTMRENISAWAWVKTASNIERPILSFSSPPSTQLTGTVTVTQGSTAVSGLGTSFTTQLYRGDRLVFSSQPSKFYSVAGPADGTGAITDNTSLTLNMVYNGPTASGVTVLRGALFDQTAAHDGNNVGLASPESRNTLFGLSINRSNGDVRAYWQHQNRTTVEVINTNVSWTDQEYVFAGFQRYLRKLAGTVTLNGTDNNITGVGTSFTTEFGTGAVANKWLRFNGDNPAGNTKYYRIVNVVSDTLLEIDPDNVTTAFPFTSIPLPAVSGASIWALRAMVHVGKMDGTFSTVVENGLPGATGGCEPEPQTVKCRGNFYIGRDATAQMNFNGSMNAVSLYSTPVDTSEDPAQIDRVMRFFWSRAFPDYTTTSNTLQRSVVSDIPDGGTVYCNYQYKTGITLAQGTTDSVTGQLDTILVGTNNPNVKNTSQLAQTIGTPDPALQTDKNLLTKSLVKYGLLVSNGHPLIKGNTDLTAYNALVQTVGSTADADSLIVNKPQKSFVLVASTEDMTEVASVDSCGRPSTTVVITERIVGINRNLSEAAMFAGFADTAPLKLKLWWIGSVGTDDSAVKKLRLMGLTGTQIAAALSLSQTDKLTVYVLPIPDIKQKLITGGMLPDDIETATNKPADEIIPIQTDPGTEATATAVQIAIAAPGGSTLDGDPNPQNPALMVAATVDLAKAFQVEPTDVDELFGAILDKADADCAALIAIVDDMLINLIRTLKKVSNDIVPFALHQTAAIGNQKLAFNKYVPCIANLSAEIALPPFTLKINFVVGLLKHLLEESAAVVRQAQRVVEKFNNLLCIPKTLIAALRGGVCGIEAPKVVAGRQCPSQLDMLLDRLQQLIDTIELMLRRMLVALTTFSADIEITIGGASRLAVDATIPCIGPVANFMLALG